MGIVKYFTLCAVGLIITACGGGGSSSPSPITNNPSPSPTTSVTVSGKITYDHISHDTETDGLDYNNITAQAARGLTVEAINTDGTVLKTTSTNDQGRYSFSLSANTEVKIQVKAQLTQSSAAKWDVSVTDNTQDNALGMLMQVFSVWVICG